MATNTATEGQAQTEGQSLEKRVPRQGSLYVRIKLARFWLPVTIAGVVLFYQLTIVPLGGEAWRFWSVLLFYSILGPIATFIILTWIAAQTKSREADQDELKDLYQELQESHSLLGAIQHVTEQFAAAPDLEAALSAATQGITQVTGARGVALFLGKDARLRHQFKLPKPLEQNAESRAQALQQGEQLNETIHLDGKDYWVLTSTVQLAGKLEGSIHAYYTREPANEQRESFNILSSEFSAAAEAARSRTRDLVTLVEVDRSIRAEGNLERLLETLLVQMMSRADASRGGVYLADEEELLRLNAVRGGTGSSNDAYPVRIGEGFIGGVAEERQASLTIQLSAAEQSGAVLGGAASAIALPLLSEQELLGVVVLAHEDAAHFDSNALPFLNLVAGQVSLAVRNARAYLQSEELAIAEERARIAREIHDGVAQSLALSALKLDLVSRLTKTDPAKAEAELIETKSRLRDMIKEVRRSIFALNPIDLERHGFVETIRRYCSDYGQQNDSHVELNVGELPQLTAKSEAVLFRIFQEAMHNVAKHSAATLVQVELGTCPDGQAYIRVEDNGVGFDLEAVGDRITTAGGLGLRQMKARVVGRGGEFKITTEAGGGTSLFASIPQ